MAKDPAFLFYPNDWLGGTLGMTFEEKGAYMELLMLQFNRGHMTKHMMGHTVGQHLDKLLDKFTQDENGLYYNVRLEEEKKKRETFTASRRNNIKGVNQFTKNDSKKEGHKKGHMTSHMENENKDIISILGKYVFKDSFAVNRAITTYSTSLSNLKESFLNFLMSEKYHEKELNELAMSKMSQHFFRWLSTHQPQKVSKDYNELMEGKSGEDYHVCLTPIDEDRVQEMINKGWVKTPQGMVLRLKK